MAPHPKRKTQAKDFPAHFHLMGMVDYEDCLSLQRRLAYDALSRGDGRLAVLLCEHPPLITIGRGGSRADVQLTGRELAQAQVALRYVARGGGAVLHGAGQLAVYVVAPLAWHGWSVGTFLRRLQQALQTTLRDQGLKAESPAGTLHLEGRSGVLAAVGVGVQNEVAWHGAFLNVNPDLRMARRIKTAGGRPMSSLLSERLRSVKMAKVRADLVTHLAAAFECPRHHLHTGHPLLADLPASNLRESAA